MSTPATPLRWARCPDDGCLHLVRAADAAGADTAHAVTLCGIQLSVDGLTISGCAGALCSGCIATGTAQTPPAPPPVRAPVARWALSPFGVAHLLGAGDDSPAGLLRTARCGAPVPGIAAIHNQPPGRKCVQCDLIDLADIHAPGRFARPDRP
ncbi:MAG: hypothetical protein ACRDTH_09105 [Pseudonocardiaceae bacterium]